MKAISLWQPWASAIAVGLKSIETRSWAAPFSMIGEPLAIHAAKRNTREQRAFWTEHVAHNGEHSLAFARGGIHSWPDMPFGRAGDMPFGAIVATATIAGVVSTNADPEHAGRDAHRGGIPCPLNTDEAWGDFSPNRFAWFLRDIVPLKAPIPCIGRQGFFNWEPV